MQLVISAEWQPHHTFGPDQDPDYFTLDIAGYHGEITFRGDVWAWEVMQATGFGQNEIGTHWVDSLEEAQSDAERAIREHLNR